MRFVYHDGGWAEAGLTCEDDNSLSRSIAIATERPYAEVHDALYELALSEHSVKRKPSGYEVGLTTSTIRQYMESMGWEWTPITHMEQGRTVHWVEPNKGTWGLCSRRTKNWEVWR